MWSNIYKYGVTFINEGGIDCEARFINFYVDIKDIKIIVAYSI